MDTNERIAQSASGLIAKALNENALTIATAIDRASQRSQVAHLKSLTDRAEAERVAAILDEMLSSEPSVTARRALAAASKMLRAT